VLEVLRRRDHEHAAVRVAREVPQRGRQREGRLPGAGGRDREEVAAADALEAVQRLLLPATETQGATHGQEPPAGVGRGAGGRSRPRERPG